MRMTKKKTALTLFIIAFVLMLLVASCAIYKGIKNNENLPVQPLDPAPETMAQQLYPLRDSQGKWGYVNAAGSLVQAAVYTMAGDFNGAAAWVQKDGLWGAIDAKGREIVPLSVEKIQDVGSGFVVGQNGKYQALYNRDGNKIFGVEGVIGQCSSDCFTLGRSRGGKLVYGYLDTNGKIIVEPLYTAAGPCVQGYMLVVPEGDGSKKLIDKTGAEYATFPSSVNLKDLGEGSIVFQNDKGLYGYYAFDGSIKLKPQYNRAQPFFGGAALVCNDGKWSLIDEQGTLLLPLDYDGGKYLGYGLYLLQYNDERAGVIVDGTGQPVLTDVCGVGEWSAAGQLPVYLRNSSCLLANDHQITQLGLVGSPDFAVVGDLLCVQDEQGMGYYNQAGEPLIVVGWQQQLTDNLVLQSTENSADYFLRLRYPQLVAVTADNEKQPPVLNRKQEQVNNRLRELAQSDWAEEYLRNDGQLVYRIQGNYRALGQGTIVSVGLFTQVDDVVENLITHEVASLTFDSRSGQVYSLTDLVKGNLDWRQTLLEPLRGQYTKDCAQAGVGVNADLISHLNQRLARTTPFMLTADGITFFISYSNGEGYQEIKLPYLAIEQQIDTKSELWQALAVENRQK